MIHRLRRRHRLLWLSLALLLPLLYAIALAARRPAPIIEVLPPALDTGLAEAGGATPGIESILAAGENAQ